jgi:hypothetical protein
MLMIFVMERRLQNAISALDDPLAPESMPLAITTYLDPPSPLGGMAARLAARATERSNYYFQRRERLSPL